MRVASIPKTRPSPSSNVDTSRSSSICRLEALFTISILHPKLRYLNAVLLSHPEVSDLCPQILRQLRQRGRAHLDVLSALLDLLNRDVHPCDLLRDASRDLCRLGHLLV